MKTEEKILGIDNLSVSYKISNGYVKAVSEVSLELNKGEVMGLVGESGCGKTTLIKALLKLLPSNSITKCVGINYKGKDISDYSEKDMQRIRWKEISLITQSAMNSLDPVYRVGDQITEAIRAHDKRVGKNEAREKAVYLFDLVGLDKERLKDYPHQYSGGMKQRAVIAMSLVHNPSIIIADEPTTALDVVVQAQILERINELQKNYQGSMIMVTHDISVIAQTCQKVAVMYGGKLVEYGNVLQTLLQPCHPYTMGLKNAFPSILGEKRDLISIPGSPPNLIDVMPGCRFQERCPFAIEKCFVEEPRLRKIEGIDSKAACHRIYELDDLRKRAGRVATWEKECCFL